LFGPFSRAESHLYHAVDPEQGGAKIWDTDIDALNVKRNTGIDGGCLVEFTVG
jgi:hypothetical protein